jgi:predicted ATPase
VTTWLKNLLSDGVQSMVLNSQLIRKASPPLRAHVFRPDGSKLPWVVASLRDQQPANFENWVAHLRTSLHDIEDIRSIERPDDKHRYLMIRYTGGLDVPSWMASDGTLRLLALTLPAYLKDFTGIFLIEEPENGIHPHAVETMFQSLSSVYDAQVLMASHSPVVLSLADPATVLCFAKSHEEATDIVLGSEHPELREWRGETNFGDLFAAGVLGRYAQFRERPYRFGA